MISGEERGENGHCFYSNSMIIIVCPLSLSNESGFTEDCSCIFSPNLYNYYTTVTFTDWSYKKRILTSKSLLTLTVPIFPLQKKKEEEEEESEREKLTVDFNPNVFFKFFLELYSHPKWKVLVLSTENIRLPPGQWTPWLLLHVLEPLGNASSSHFPTYSLPLLLIPF